MSLTLSALCRALETIAPLGLAEDWDNAGLLVDPRAPGAELDVDRVLLTIDATPAVLEEAAQLRIGCLVAYHPPVFRALKRFSAARDAALFGAARAGHAVYSPHSALDAAPGGLNDWFAEAFGPARVAPLELRPLPDAGAELKLVVFVPESHTDALREALAAAGAGVIGDYSRCSFNLAGEGTFFGEAGAAPVVGEAGRLERAPEIRMEMVCARRALPALARAIAAVHPYEEPAWDVYPLEPKPDPRAGVGRRVELDAPAPLGALVERVKRHLGLSLVRVAESARHARGAPIQRVAIGVGAGGATFAGVHDADLYVTGEMRHHDVLAKLAEGASVVLCEHTNTERGYLPRYRERLAAATGGAIEILLAESDREPLSIV